MRLASPQEGYCFLESRVRGNVQARFGEGRREKGRKIPRSPPTLPPRPGSILRPVTNRLAKFSRHLALPPVGKWESNRPQTGNASLRSNVSAAHANPFLSSTSVRAHPGHR